MGILVEDQTLVRMFVSDFLDETGFKVFEAVTVLQAHPNVQAVVTDTGMPQLDEWPCTGPRGSGAVARNRRFCHIGAGTPGPDDLSGS
ncbi:hypothetical protein BB934_02385 [Microvirga ossetica]|uniref:Response regulatory domain-containing protein n=1 Tax=Microvirga ossetica TaxID=1882682 RepID=A0A1B2EB69_9HYPH|nr:hypothetical protein BB934_02385 [Microvirga ossetica]